jgi:uncharacterized membrane protein
MMWKFIIHMFAALGYGAGVVWGIIEGIDYFVNQDLVNWTFLFPLIAGLVIAIVNMALIFKDR